MLAISLALARPLPPLPPLASAQDAPALQDTAVRAADEPAAPVPATPVPAAAQLGPAAVPAPYRPHDPLIGFNRITFAVSQPIDHFVFRPVALVYTKAVPHPLRDGIHNFLKNLFEPVVFVNDVLQLRLRRAGKTAARMFVNTTLGIGGLFDVAKRRYIGLPGHANGFGDTLGFYGIGPGPYLYLPILGPTSLRDAIGGVGDYYSQPRLLGKMLHPDNDKSIFHSRLKLGPIGTATFILGGIDTRARNDASLEAIKHGSVDPYATLRSAYQQDRAGEIAALKAKDGAAMALPQLDDPLIDPEAGAPLAPKP